MAHGKIDADYTDDLISGKFHFIFYKIYLQILRVRTLTLLFIIILMLFNHQSVPMKPNVIRI